MMRGAVSASPVLGAIRLPERRPIADFTLSKEAIDGMPERERGGKTETCPKNPASGKKKNTNCYNSASNSCSGFRRLKK
jgi:hypothetical protein